MQIIVLGSAAGGGVPQWNSNAEACRRARAGDPVSPSRTQASVAVSGNGTDWVLLNAAPDLRQQINQTPALHPRDSLRHSPIRDVILTGGEIDSIAGLLTLRERHRFTLRATRAVLDILDANPIFAALAPDMVTRAAQSFDTPVDLSGGLAATLFAIPGKRPLFAEAAGHELRESEDTAGLELRQDGKRLVYVPGCAAMTEALALRLQGADLVFFDGTLWRDDEMIAQGLGPKTGQRMGHMSVSGPDGTLAALADLHIGRRVLIHLNNSNPVLLADSPERRAVEAAGWQVAHDGLEMHL